MATRASLGRASQGRAGRPGSGRRRACGRPDPLQLAQRARTGRRRRARGTRTTTRQLRAVADGRPGRAPRRARGGEQRERVVDGAGLAGDRGEPAAGRQVGLEPLGDLALGEAGRVPAHQRLERRVRGVADGDAPGRRAGPGRRRWPSGAAPPRSARRSARASSSQVSSSTTAAYPPSATGSAPGVAHDDLARRPTVGEHLVAAGAGADR